MNVTIIGASDAFARGLATWAVAAGHNVSVVGFNLAQATALASTIKGAQPKGPSDSLTDTLIFVAMPFNCVLDAGNFYGKQFDGKIVVDVTTPINPDTVEAIIPEAGSVAEEIAKMHPTAKVVKAFNPRFSGALVAGENSGEEADEVLLAGDDFQAKRTVAQFFNQGGLRATDLGPLRRAGELEAAGHRRALNRGTARV